MNRRRFLAAVGAGLGLSSGCIGRDSTPMHSPDRATGSPSSAEASTDLCQGDFDRIDYSAMVEDTVKEGPIGAFDLTVSPDSVPLGDQLTVRLENIGETPQTTPEASTGNKNQYIIERQTGDGWQSIFWEAEQETAVWNSEAVRHATGEGFTWELTLTRSGLERGWYHVCEPLRAGTYRFVYFGLMDDHALGTEFTVTQD